MFFVENSKISFLVGLSLDTDCLLVSLTWTLRFLLKNSYTIYNTTTVHWTIRTRRPQEGRSTS